MKIELCSFSGFKIYPGHGKTAVGTDSRVHHFITKKCYNAYKKKINPTEVRWTVLYRRKHKKGDVEEFRVDRIEKRVKVERGVAGMTLTDLLAKRNQKPEVRQAQREQAVRAAKEKAKVKADKSAAKKMPTTKKASKPVQSKGKAAKPRVGGKR